VAAPAHWSKWAADLQNHYDEHVAALNVRLKAKRDAFLWKRILALRLSLMCRQGHISLDKIAGASRYIEAIGGRVGGWDCLQSRAPMVG